MSKLISGFVKSATNVYFAMVLFLVVTVVFSLLYSVVLPAIEGSPSLSHNLKGVAGGGAVTFVDCLYFSATTQTTVGYGDMIPATVLGKICTMIQAVFGYFYLAFMVSLLMARALVEPKRRQDTHIGREKTNGKILRLH